MTVTVTVDAPESITRERLFEWLADLGIEAKGVQRVVIERGGVSIEAYATDANGKRYVVGSTDEDMRVATHTVVIPITD